MKGKQRWELINHFSVYTTGKDDLSDDWFFLGQDMALKEALYTFNQAVTNTPVDNCFLSFEGSDVLAYDPDTRNVTNMSDNFDSINDSERQWISDRDCLKSEIIDYCDKFYRANSSSPTIFEYFEEDDNHGDFDSFDCNGDIEGSVTCVSLTREQLNTRKSDPEDQFIKFVYNNVRVVREMSEPYVVCDWSGFVLEHYKAFQEYASKSEYTVLHSDKDEFIQQVMNSTHYMLAGYLTDEIEDCMKALQKHTEPSDEYKEYIQNELIPYALPENRRRYEEILQGGKKDMTENLVPMPGIERLSELKAEYDPAVRKAAADFDAGRKFPENGNFDGLKNFRIIAELNDTVLGVRDTDHTYATWSGDSEYGVSAGNYMLTREKAFEDFAIRAQMIDIERYKTKETEREECQALIKNWLDFNGSSLSDEQFNELTDIIVADLHSNNLLSYVVETNTEDYRKGLFENEPLDLVGQDKNNKL